MDQKSKGTGYGAYDPLYPNGIMTAGKDGDLFGIRFLAAGKEEGLILDHKDFDFRTVGIGRMEPEQLYEFSWKAFGTTVKLTWCRLGKDCLFGQVDLQDGVSVLAELYVPREWRLQKEWVNFTRQTESCFTGELISPYHEMVIRHSFLWRTRLPGAVPVTMTEQNSCRISKLHGCSGM